MRQHWTVFVRRCGLSVTVEGLGFAATSDWASVHERVERLLGLVQPQWDHGPLRLSHRRYAERNSTGCRRRLSFHTGPEGSTHRLHTALSRELQRQQSSLVGLCLASPCLALPCHILRRCLHTWSAAAAGEAFSFSATLSRGETIGDVTSDPGLLRRPFRTACSGAVPAAGLKNSFIMTAEAEPVPAITACSLVLCLAKSTSCSTQHDSGTVYRAPTSRAALSCCGRVSAALALAVPVS